MKIIVISLFFLAVLAAFAGAQSFVHKSILEGETQTVVVDGISYSIKLVLVADASGKAVFEVNGKPSKPIGAREGYDYLDGSKIRVGEVLIQEGRDGRDYVEYYFYSAKSWQDYESGEYAVGEGSKELPGDLPPVEKVSYEDLAPLFQQKSYARQYTGEQKEMQDSGDGVKNEEVGKGRVEGQGERTPAPAEKKGFFASILNWFLDLFR